MFDCELGQVCGLEDQRDGVGGTHWGGIHSAPSDTVLSSGLSVCRNLHLDRDRGKARQFLSRH